VCALAFVSQYVKVRSIDGALKQQGITQQTICQSTVTPYKTFLSQKYKFKLYQYLIDIINYVTKKNKNKKNKTKTKKYKKTQVSK
jgi:hypothetical protein